jgi:hypothetical protein
MPFPTAGSVSLATGENIFTAMSLAPTYSYQVLGATPAATATDVIVLQGSATKLVRIRRIYLGGFATAAGSVTFSLIRRSTAGSGGTSTAPTPVKLATSSPAASAAVRLFTANPTVGTAVATIQSGRINMGVAAAIGAPVLLDFYETSGIILSGTSDYLALTLNGSTIPTAGVLDAAFYWTEE